MSLINSKTLDATSGKVGQNLTVGGTLSLTGTTSVMILNILTTTQRDALTGSEGMLIFNTTDNKLNFYTGTGWEAVDFS